MYELTTLTNMYRFPGREATIAGQVCSSTVFSQGNCIYSPHKWRSSVLKYVVTVPHLRTSTAVGSDHVQACSCRCGGHRSLNTAVHKYRIATRFMSSRWYNNDPGQLAEAYATAVCFRFVEKALLLRVVEKATILFSPWLPGHHTPPNELRWPRTCTRLVLCFTFTRSQASRTSSTCSHTRFVRILCTLVALVRGNNTIDRLHRCASHDDTSTGDDDFWCVFRTAAEEVTSGPRQQR